MNYRIIASLITIGVASAGLGYGTFAYFSDTEEVANNIFSTVTLDLTPEGSTLTGTFTSGALAPCDTVPSESITLTNAGTIANSKVDLDIDAAVGHTEGATDPDTGAGPSPAPNTLASYIEVTTFSFNGLAIPIGEFDPDGAGPGTGDGRANTLDDLVNLGPYNDRSWPASGSGDLVMAFKFLCAGPNHLQGDSLDLDLTLVLGQNDAGAPDLP